MKMLWYLAYIPALIWMLIIGGFSGSDAKQSSSLSLDVTERLVEIIDIGEPMSEQEFYEVVELLHAPVRKFAHMTEFAILYVLLIIPSAVLFGMNKKIVGIVLLICVLFAMSDEFHQTFTPGRDGNITDVLIDSLGAAIGMLVSLGVNKFTNSKIKGKSK